MIRTRHATRRRLHATALAAALAAGLGLALQRLPAQQARAVPDPGRLPLTEVPSTHGAARALVVLISGDGGWASLDKQVAATLAGAGVGVVGIDARAWLSDGRTPDVAAHEVEGVMRHYLAAWHVDRVALVGYSRGADVAPFLAARLAPDLRARLDLVAMFGLASHANFTFHWSDLVRDTSRPSDLAVAPELARLRGTRMLCVYGSDETDSGCRAADSTLIERVGRTGGHHLDGDYAGLARLVLARLGPAGTPAAR